MATTTPTTQQPLQSEEEAEQQLLRLAYEHLNESRSSHALGATIPSPPFFRRDTMPSGDPIHQARPLAWVRDRITGAVRPRTEHDDMVDSWPARQIAEYVLHEREGLCYGLLLPEGFVDAADCPRDWGFEHEDDEVGQAIRAMLAAEEEEDDEEDDEEDEDEDEDGDEDEDETEDEDEDENGPGQGFFFTAQGEEQNDDWPPSDDEHLYCHGPMPIITYWSRPKVVSFPAPTA